jgi:hypothetical protein
MIVAEAGADWRLVTQNDHAAFAAELLGAWRSLARAPWRDLLLRATRLHDNGWRETDSAPRIDPRGAPQSFLSVPAAERHRLWERGMDRYRATDPACALLIVEHALWLHRDGGELTALLAAARSRREELLADVPQGANLLAALYPWLRLADDLSLRSCWGRRGRFTIHDPDGGASVRGSLAPRSDPDEALDHGRASSTSWNLSLDPFPLAGATTFSVRCRWIARRPYRDDTDLGTTLAVAHWGALSVQVGPMPGAGEPVEEDGRDPAEGRSGPAC